MTVISKQRLALGKAALDQNQSPVTLQRLNQEQFQKFRSFIYDQCGIRIESNKLTLLSNRIRRRLVAGDFVDFDDYYRFLTSPRGSGELNGFLDAITTNETFFFRTEKQFDWLKDEWLTEQIALQRQGKRAPELRIWSAGCATGAEAYTIGICLAENLYRLNDWSLQILATDISEEALASAREGVYKERLIDAVSARQRKRFFTPQQGKDQWKLRSTLKEWVKFQQHNLLHRMNARPFDLIFIRNVLIYFDEQSKQKVIQNLIRSLADGGYLVIGPSEGVYGMLQSLERVTPLIYRKAGRARATLDVNAPEDGAS